MTDTPSETTDLPEEEDNRKADPEATEEYSYQPGEEDSLVDFLDAAFQQGSNNSDQGSGVPANARIGRYQLLQKIGQGGMGVVYRAEQTEPVQRQVALKLIRLRDEQNADRVAARFEAERQAVALMNHPNICRMLDGGTHDGCPWFAMELVEGVPITEFCDGNQLSISERLELFLPVCAAIQLDAVRDLQAVNSHCCQKDSNLEDSEFSPGADRSMIRVGWL